MKKGQPMKKNKLTPLEWHIYRFIEARTYGTGERLTQREIYESCKEAGYDVSWNETQNQHHDHCRWLSTAIERINQSMEVDKLISHRAYRYRLCNESEAEALLSFYEKKIVASKVRYKRLLKKMKRNNQGKTTTNAGTTLKKDTKPFHEVYNPVEDDE